MSINSYTTYFNFRKIDFNTRPWHEDEWANWDLLDSILGASLNQTDFGTGGGTANAQTFTSLSTPYVGYTAGMVLAYVASATNTGVATLAVDGLSAKSIVNNEGAGLVAGDITSGRLVQVVYDGTQFRMLTSSARVANSGLEQVAEDTIKGRLSAGTGNVEDIALADLKTALGTAADDTAVQDTVGLRYLGVQTLNAANVNWDIELTGTTYRGYKIIIPNVYAQTTAISSLTARLSFDNAATFKSDSQYRQFGVDSWYEVVDTQTAAIFFSMLYGTYSLTSTSSTGCSIEFDIITPRNAEAFYTRVNMNNIAGSASSLRYLGIYQNATTRASHIRLVANNNMAAGLTASVYGYY